MRFFRYDVHKLVPIQNACVRNGAITQQKIDGIISKMNQFIYTLACNYIVLLAANGGCGIQVSETPIFRVFKGIMSFRAVSMTYLHTTANLRRTLSTMN